MKTTYHKDTPQALQRVLNKAREHITLVRLIYGETTTGKPWLEENDVVGFIGRSTGTVQVPLIIEALIDNMGEISKADGGPQLLDHCILRVIDCHTGRDLYRHAKYQLPKLDMRESVAPEYRKVPWEVRLIEGAERVTQARFPTEERALEYIAFVQGIKSHMPLRSYQEWLAEEKGNRDD